MSGEIEKPTKNAQTLPPNKGVFLCSKRGEYTMTTKKIERIIFYDEEQHKWITDTMETESPNDGEAQESNKEQKNLSGNSQSDAYE